MLDTNVISELARTQANPKVVAWAEAQPEHTTFISVLTLAEFDKGIAALPADAPARPRLKAAVVALENRFRGRVLSVVDGTVRRWGRISGAAKLLRGQSPPVVDTLLAATAIEHDLCLVTRNVRDVRDTGALVFNPSLLDMRVLQSRNLERIPVLRGWESSSDAGGIGDDVLIANCCF